MVVDITSTKNPRVVELARLHDARERRRTGLTVVEGPHAVAAAAAGGAAIELVLTAEDGAEPLEGVETLRVTPAVLRKVAGTEHPRGPVAVVQIPASPEPAARDTLVLAGVGDPGNAGTLLRSAAAFGLQCVVLAGSVDVWAPKVLRAAAGAHWLAPPVTVDDASALRSAGLTTVAAVPVGGGVPEAALAGDGIAILIGHEAHGISPRDLAEVDRLVTIPMPGGAESLNAAVAGSILCYVRSRMRAGGGGADD